jgi:hypothetical protein
MAAHVMRQHEHDVSKSPERAEHLSAAREQRRASWSRMRRRVPWVALGVLVLVVVAAIVGGVVLLVMR